MASQSSPDAHELGWQDMVLGLISLLLLGNFRLPQILVQPKNGVLLFAEGGPMSVRGASRIQRAFEEYNKQR